MLVRLLILLALAGAAIVVWRIVGDRAARSRDASGLAPLGYCRGLPAILYFTAPGCAPCEAVQKPALTRLADRLSGGVQILEVDAVQNPWLADAWGVLAVPTTFVIDRFGRPRRVNHGPTREGTLVAQLAEIGEPQPGLESPTAPDADSIRQRGANEGKHHGTIARPG
jgi:thiol-disulfide isomerase/thioredoxin